MIHASLDDVVFALVDALDAQSAEYAVIGGLAVNAWGFARATQDVDVCVAIDARDRPAVDAILDDLEARGFRLNRDAVARRLDAGRSLVTAYLGLTRADLFFRRPGDGWGGALAHRRQVPLGDRSLWVASPEDLVAIKLAAARPRDLDDARGVVDITRDALDVDRLRATVRELADATGAPQLVEDLEALLAEAPPSAPSET